MPPPDANGADASAEPSAAPTVEDDIREAIAALSAREPEAPAETEGKAIETEAEARARDERGRFASKPEGEQPEAVDEKAGAPAPAEPSKPERLAVPSGWPADAKTQWDKLSRPVQEAIQADLAAGKFRLGGEASAPDPVVSAARNFEADARAVGADLATYTERSLAWARHIAASPEAGIRELAQTLGVDLRRLVPSQDGSGSHEVTSDPELLSLRREVAELRSHMSSQRVSSAQSEVDAWASEKDASGNPVRAHYAALDQTAFAHRVALERQLNPGLSAREVLQRAYDAEVYAQPSVRSLVLDAQRAAEDAKREGERKAREAEAARARSVSVRGSHSPAAAGQSDPVMNETPEQTLARVMAASRNG